jgi:hypothetical protein
MTNSKFVYCAHCGTPLEVYRKAMAQFNKKILDLVPPHQCSPNCKTLEELEIFPDPAPTFAITEKVGQFVQNLDKLNKQVRPAPVIDPGDRRPGDQVKQTTIAPKTLLDMVLGTHSEGEDPREN